MRSGNWAIDNGEATDAIFGIELVVGVKKVTGKTKNGNYKVTQIMFRITLK